MEFDNIEFTLPDSFIEKYKKRPVKWGPLGYFVYRRTYSRPLGNKSEEWWQTVRRVVEGCFLIQKRHCKLLATPWNQRQALSSAQKMYDLIWNFKFMPAGRGLWAMGTNFVFEKGSACLNNCAGVTTAGISQDFSAPFVWLKEMSMLGVGVGFDTEGAKEDLLLKPPRKLKSEVHIVEDSRQGWVDVFRRVLDSYVRKDTLPESFDYSQVRPAGSSISGFGGRAPGFEPLQNLVSKTINLLDHYQINNKSIDSTLIVDLMNLAGEAVVSGGIRRSSEISLGDPNDQEFMNLKSLENINDPTRARWASNNSVICDLGQDYTDIAARAALTGEPGILFLNNARNYGRMADGYNPVDHRVAVVNPCIISDTLVAVADGRGSVSIGELANKGEDVPVYCHDFEGNLKIKLGRNPRLTGKNVPVVKVIIENDHTIICTPNHKFLTRKRGVITEVEAKDLKPNSSLVMLSRYIPDGRSYSRVDQYISMSFSATMHYEHPMIYQFHNDIDITNKHVHHLDENKLNNNIDNLFLEDEFDHLSSHSTGLSNPRAYDLTNYQLFEYGVNLCKRLERRFSKNEWEIYAKENQLPTVLSKYRQQALGRIGTFSKNCAIKANTSLELSRYNYLVMCLQKAIEQGYTAKLENNHVIVDKVCEKCKSIFQVLFARREQSFCSKKCSLADVNKNRDYSLNRKGMDRRSKSLAEENANEQLRVLYFLFDKLERQPYKIEWVEECRNQGVPTRLHKNSKYKTYKELCRQVPENHKVISVEPAGFSDVYNITVDDYHNIFIGGFPEKTSKNRDCVRYFGVMQCGEQPLENKELCCLAETIPSLHNSLDEYLDTLKYAYLYAKTVTLVPTHDERTNAVMFRNRRIGLSQTGVIENINKIGYRAHMQWCDKGYRSVRHWDEIYSDWLCVPKSIKVTTCKPSGSVSLLPGVSPGVHWPHAEFYTRRVRVSKSSNLWRIIEAAGYTVEEDSYEKNNTMVIEFPVHEPFFSIRKGDVSMWEQLELAANMQHFWSDNSVSITVTVKPEEAKDLARALSMYESRLKSVSFLPLKADTVYVQAPYEEITKEKYEKALSKIKKYKLDFEEPDRIEEKFCSNDSCQV